MKSCDAQKRKNRVPLDFCIKSQRDKTAIRVEKVKVKKRSITDFNSISKNNIVDDLHQWLQAVRGELPSKKVRITPIRFP